jgi:serine/threonine-protein kinase Psk1
MESAAPVAVTMTVPAEKGPEVMDLFSPHEAMESTAKDKLPEGPGAILPTTATANKTEDDTNTGARNMIPTDRARQAFQNHATSLPVRIASPSPARFASPLKANNLPDEKLDFEKVRQRAARKKKNKRKPGPGAPAVQVIKGFQTPSSCGEDSEASGASTPALGQMSRNISSASITSSPALRPSTPQSGISALRLQLDALGLGNRSPTPRLMSLQRVNTGSATSEAASDSDRTEMDSYEIPLQNDFVNLDVSSKGLPISGINTPRLQSNVRKVTAQDFEPISCLGKGSFGTVVLVKQHETGRLFAQKQFKKASLVVRKKLVDQTRTERDILKSIRHPFIVKLYYAFQDHEKLYLILEYAQGGELFHHLSMERMFPEDTARFYMAEMVLALEHLHRVVGVVYRDLKPENCLLDAEGHLLLTDFGLSKVPVDDADKCRSFLGTVEYMAPEVVAGKEYGMAVDWWSFGALSYDLLTGSPPFTANNNAKTQEKILKAKLQLPYFLGPDAKDLLTRLLRKDPSKRLGANMPKDLNTIKNHRFFKTIGWRALATRELDPPIQPVITDPELAENFSSDFTGLSLSPTVSRKSFGDALDGYGALPGEGLDGDPFGGFSFHASSSVLNSGVWG